MLCQQKKKNILVSLSNKSKSFSVLMRKKRENIGVGKSL